MAIDVAIRLVLGFVVLWALTVGLLFALRPRNVKATELVRAVPDIARLVRGLVLDPAVPKRVRLALLILLVWLINPIDLIPEFIPVLGPLDDVVVAVLVLRYVRRELGDEALRRRWPGTDDGFELLVAVLGGH